MPKPVRHILGISGGKDSTALAVLMHKRVPQMEYFFCDTGKELPETYEYLERVQARLGIRIERLSAERNFDFWLDIYNGFLPSPNSRWCTKQLKIAPLEKFIGDDAAVSYVGIRADEHRDGYISTRPNIEARYPFKEEGLGKEDIIRLLDDSGIGMPAYYSWRSRSGCSFCFFQRKYEWVMLAEKHPEEFAEAVKYEQAHSDGRRYLWAQDEPLTELLERREQIIADHEKTMARMKKARPNQRLEEVFASALDDEDAAACNVCHL
jgi:3'-phosphoadenosine 5'-phosphosulfate sulfotransferase (PAPS reductase)/FAD synthetase